MDITDKAKEITDKNFYFIVTAADTDQSMLARTIEDFRAFTEDCLPSSHEKGVIYGTGAWQIGKIKNSPAMRQVYEMGKQV